MGVTIRQIAQEAGVSRGTVDRVLNNRGRVRPEVDKKVREIARELGYRPNLLGRALGMSRNDIKIGVVIQASETSFIKAVLAGVQTAAAEVENSGGTVLVEKIPGIDADKVLRAMEHMREQGIHAIALMPVEDQRIREKVNQFVEEYQIPIVTFNGDLEAAKRLCFVGQNAYLSGKTAAGLMGEFFRENGGTIAMISGFASNSSLSRRISGFREVMEKQYPKIHLLDTVYCQEDEEQAERLTEQILKEYPEVSGIYMTCFGENGVCRALRKQGKEQDIVLVASDLTGNNYELLEEGLINLIVGQEDVVQGYEPVMILYRLLFNGEKPKEEYQYTDIVIKTKYNV